MIDGIDVSYYQGTIDWGKVAKTKRFAIVRSGDGTFLDPLFEQNIEGALGAGLHVEIYHYLRLALTVQDQRDILGKRWWKAVDLGMSTDARLWLDFEDTTHGATWQGNQRWLLSLLGELDLLPLGIYTGLWWWQPNVGSPPCNHIPLWIGQYPFIDGCPTDPTQAGLAPTLPTTWDNWLIWQYTSKGRCLGIEGNVDLNVAQDSFLKEDDMATTERRVELLEEAAEARALHEMWLAHMGKASEAAAWEAYIGHIQEWRLKGNGWTPPV